MNRHITAADVFETVRKLENVVTDDLTENGVLLCASELLGISEDSLLERLNRKRQEIIWTDGDTQCLIGHTKAGYWFAEVRDTGKEYAVCYAAVDPADYSDEEIESCLSAYYKGGRKEVEETYGDNAERIIAEYLFESLPTDMMCGVVPGYATEKKAAKYLSSYAAEMNIQLNDITEEV